MIEKTRYVDREIPHISLKDFEKRIDDITQELRAAAENTGFFAITDHGISETEVNSMFKLSEQFFVLPEETKATVPWTPQNVGWESRGQVRPATGLADQKETYNLQFGENMKNTWLSDDVLPGFKDKSLGFMRHVQEVSERLMICLARGLGFKDDYFHQYHDIRRPDLQSVLRLLHYFEVPKAADTKPLQRCGAHADWGFLTLLFQKPGQSGLEICPEREVVTEQGHGNEWTKVKFEKGMIVCNIGDLLMSWSDDRFKSTLHRVKAPSEEGDFYDERYSIAFFNQPVKDAIIQGPKKKYPAVTGEEFTRKAMEKYYSALKKTLASQKTERGTKTKKRKAEWGGESRRHMPRRKCKATSA
ncbi:hypothetical protein BDV96DRAFT_626266 [Lophiotrema nucula]|uniref:Fe2OG dioxygenase domain-containing protein n=1 Tax=Lophiotrema nucula TaxID=690887 RepID=A0A6A5YET8_9PLEO|nr:hypothetical protein BDV96DRAFT_626266 [Lophiotrema nucula]